MDRVKWTWSYEPTDLNGYIPDFIVDGDRELLIEIKSDAEDFAVAEYKIESSGWDGEALIVASRLDGPVLGRLWSVGNGPREWSQAQLFRCISCGSVSVLSAELSWHCRMCGVGGGNGHVGEYDPQSDWVEACNRVQWRAAK